MPMRTTGVEVLTPVGGRACIDANGWHSGESKLLAELETRCPPMQTGEDPILDTAQRAAKDLGLKILVIRRHAMVRETFVAKSTRVLRALTDSTLHRSLFGAEGDAIDVPRRSRRLLILAIVCVGLGAAAILYGWLADHP